MLRIIDNKRIDLTDTEFQYYQELVKAYSAQNRSGEEYFKELFETDKNGIIIFMKPPTKAFTSMECYMFLVNVMIHQHLGAGCERLDASISESKQSIAEINKVIIEAKQIIADLKKVRALQFR